MRKNIVIVVPIIVMLICLLLSGCVGSKQLSSPIASSDNETISPTPKTPHPKSILDSDFDINYNGILLNEKTSLEELAKLNLPICDASDVSDEFIDYVKAYCTNNDMDYTWYKIPYPSGEKTEFVIEYLYNSTLKTGYIISLNLVTLPTKRGVKVGDTFDKVKSLYYDNMSLHFNTNTTKYLVIEFRDKTIDMVYEIATEKILHIDIDYNRDKAMDEAGITSFD